MPGASPQNNLAGLIISDLFEVPHVIIISHVDARLYTFNVILEAPVSPGVYDKINGLLLGYETGKLRVHLFSVSFI